MLRGSILSMRIVASLCRPESTTTINNATSNEKERQNVKHLQKLSLLRDQHSSERWTTDDELQAIYLRNGIEFCNKLFQIDLSEFEPLYQLNNKPIVYREDFERETPSREEILSNAAMKNEKYIIAPPIPSTIVRQESTMDKK